ncbi:MAG: YdeI/OmpD-associated family protein [Symbiobacteriaceae bacterium]|nr:YdeI/OmpD-associated family protein [Symbiobacteriaceae bacterium]
MRLEFDSEISQLEGKIKWHVLYFPYSAAEHFGSKGNIPVCITVDGHSFDHTLLPSKNGHYLVYNEFIKRVVGKNLGDSVHVTLEKDEKKREVVIPAPIEAMLMKAGVLERFLSQADYTKREQLNHIELAKKEETKSNRLAALIKQLAEQS